MINKWIGAILIVSCFTGACKDKRKQKTTNIEKPVSADTSLKWIDYHIGELPPVGYYAAFDSVIKKWNIRYQRIEGGCEATPEERNVYEKRNPQYFKLLEKRLGKNWMDRFYAEVKILEKKLNKSN